MAKHGVPKRKQSKTRSNRRYHTFENLARLKLAGMARVVPCPQCGKARQNHTVCASCGMYRGRNVVNKQKDMAKVTKVKA